MDYVKLAEGEIEARTAVYESIKVINDDPAKTDAEKREAIEKAEAEMQEHEERASEYVEKAEREAAVRNLSDKTKELRKLNPAGNNAAPELRGNEDTGEDFEKEIRRLYRGEIREIESFISPEMEARLAKTNTAGNVQELVHTTFTDRVLENLRWVSDVLKVATTINTASGETWQWPVLVGRPTAAVVAEGAVYPTSDDTWSTFSLSVTKYGVMVQATEEALTDPGVNIAPILASTAADAVAEKFTADVMTNVLAAVTSSGLAGGVTADNLISLQFAVLPPYRRNGAYLMSDQGAMKARLLKDTTGQYLWQPSLIVGAPDIFAGKPVYVDAGLPTAAPAGNAEGILFGQLDKILVRQVKSLRIVRSDEYGFDKDVVTWKVTYRGGSGVQDLTAIKSLQVTN